MADPSRSSRWLFARIGLALLSAAVLAAGPKTAAAFAITDNSGSAFAETTYTVSWLPGQREQRTFGPGGGAAVAHVTDPFSRARAAQTGYGLNAVTAEARVGDVPSFFHSAGTSFDVTVRNDDAVTSDPLIFEYHLNGGQLALFGGSFDGMVAGVSVSIFTIAPGRSGFLWSWALSLRGQGGQVTTSVDFLLDPLGFGVPALSPITIANNEATVSIAPFTAVADLGRLAPGGTAFITYDMGADIGGFGFNSTGGKATLGDPLNLDGDPGSSIGFAGVDLQPAPAAAPEPATGALAALGLALLAAVRSRRCRATGIARRRPVAVAPQEIPS